jgi:hypothetical protein
MRALLAWEDRRMATAATLPPGKRKAPPFVTRAWAAQRLRHHLTTATVIATVASSANSILGDISGFCGRSQPPEG